MSDLDDMLIREFDEATDNQKHCDECGDAVDDGELNTDGICSECEEQIREDEAREAERDGDDVLTCDSCGDECDDVDLNENGLCDICEMELDEDGEDE